MRLLDTSAVQLHEFFDSEIPKYAILSHRWEDGEISFKDVTEVDNLQAPGWVKVRKSCEIAKSLGYPWIWIDTCCIDKSSSTELNEAIKSMFKWYREAEVCLVYICDVRKDLNVSRHFKTEKSHEDSVWFGRGWTLQELLAPREMTFYDMDWSSLGTRSGLVDELHRVTGIDAEYLGGGTSFRSACIATKMSWMANRTTKRKEDMAYAMLGIFNVNMTPDYGEGEHAFVRLQQNLLEMSKDESLFAWRMTNDDVGGTSSNEWGLLAPHPKCFKESQRLTTVGETIPRPLGGGFSKAQEGIKITVASVTLKNRYKFLALIPPLNFILLCVELDLMNTPMTVLPLNCWQRDELGKMKRVQLYLRQCPREKRFFKRCRCTEYQLKDSDRMIFTRYNRYRNDGSESYIVLQPQQA